MNIIFFLEPAIELGNPVFRYPTLRGSIISQVVALKNAGANVHCIMSTAVAEHALRDGHMKALGTVSVIDPIQWTEGENSYERSLRHQDGTFREGEVDRLTALIKEGLPEGFTPDMVLVWETPMPYLQSVFPEARIMYQMPGFFSRAPYSELISFDDGLLKDSSNSAFDACTPEEQVAIQELREYERRFLNSVAPTKVALGEAKKRFQRVVLLPLQIDNYFMINSVIGRKSQFDVLIEILEKLPSDYALLVTNYWSGQTRSAVLTRQNIEYLRARYSNFVYIESFDNIPSVSQLIVPDVDGVITISSSLGYQAAFWQKPLLTLGDSHISKFASASKLQAFLAQISARETPSRDSAIIAAIKTQHIPIQHISAEGDRYLNWLQKAREMKAGSFPDWTNGVDFAEYLKKFRREEDYLKQLGYSARVNNESSIDHCVELSHQIAKHPVISFDIFDTLLYRPLKSPSDMFTMMEEEVRAICDIPSLNFKNARRAAEKAAFEAAIARGEGETHIDHIYHAFSQQQGVSFDIANKVKELEMQTEMDILYPRSSGFKAFNEAKSLGRRIILISDMYLPKSFLEEVLHKNGYTGYDKFYVSSEAKVKKHNGRLFDYVLKDLNIPAKNILHVGDNLAADVIKAKDRGIKPFHLVKASEVFAECDSYTIPWKRDEERHALDWQMMLAIIGNRFHDNPYLPHRRGTLFCGEAWRLGYAAHGPLLLGYVKWVMEKAIRDKVDRLYFLSRDGLIMKEAYDRIAKLYPDAPKSIYLLCSRRAVNLAKVKDVTGVMDLLHVDFSRTTLRHLLTTRFGLHVSEIPEDVLARHDLTLDTVVSNKHQEMLKPFFIEMLPVILSTAEKERSNYLSYLKQVGLLDEGNVSIVDIGYAGTMQESLYQLTEKQKLFGGYYLITFRQALKRVDTYGMPSRGYLGEFIDRHDTFHPFCKFVPLYETLFSSKDSSFIRMDLDWNNELTPVFMERFPAEARREEVVHMIHSGALDFIDETCAILGRRLPAIDIEPNKSLRLLDRFFSAPHPVDAQIFSGVVFEDAYGGAGLKTILPPPDKVDENCVWKAGMASIKGHLEAQKKAANTAPAAKGANGIGNAARSELQVQPLKHLQNEHKPKFEHKVIQWLVRRTSNDRKFKKFQETPGKFFADSKAAHVRIIGNIYMRRYVKP
ncbi:HAD-IA family hydrolase [Pseudomonas sp. NPDC089428]|uniref:HAD-IA family hydrolase n=1 Tax=Pseudomonas sp. NPDC089428 TaxID=3364467 RepID=UPI00380308B5